MRTSVLPRDMVPRALVHRDTRDVFKIVADSHTKILGVHVVENVGDVIYSGIPASWRFGCSIWR